MSLQNSISPLLGKIGDSDFELENCKLKLLDFLLNIFRVEISNI